MKWIAIAIIISTAMVIYFSPYQSYMRSCIGDKQYCTWYYYEITKEESWLRRVLIELGR